MLVIAFICFIIGLALIDYNQNNVAKHNILIGVCGWVLTLIIPLGIICYKYF